MQTDLQYDFVMVYGTDPDMPNRIRQYREKGYVVHLMTGSAWGNYQDYLNGQWDGQDHWDESQLDRQGNPILHGVDVPYLCPSMAFAQYLTQSLYPAVDAGVEGVHLEEPEFWDDGGYSEGFKREYQAFYGEAWTPPHLSPESRHRASRLKVYLYGRLVAFVSAQLKKYAREKYGRELQFYVPTHSLVNYTQWKILSPEATLLDIPTVDGYIAQVWTGTSRCGNVYMGKYDERTFETAFLEYGVMQELIRGTGRRMWFLHDPVEDNPEHTWEDFKKNYLMTVTASLFHPLVHHYEISPWPTRVFNGIYPKKWARGGGIRPGDSMEGAKPIPESYAALLCQMTQTLSDMDQSQWQFDEKLPRIGIFMADSGLYQRTFPDSVPHSDAGVGGLNDTLFSMLLRKKAGENTDEPMRALMDEIQNDEGLYHDYIASGPFPHFFGMAMPLIKCGLPLRPVQLENVVRYEDYLQDYDMLILSYEYLKPDKPDYHAALKKWVEQGGKLIYAGDGSDPYHQVQSWWNTSGLEYANPAQHLFDLLNISPMGHSSVHAVGRGKVAVYPLSPARITLTKQAALHWRDFVLDLCPAHFTCRHYFLMRRGPYVIAHVMPESVSDAPLKLQGCYADMLENDFTLRENVTLQPGQDALVFDLDAIGHEPLRIIGTSARIFSLDETADGYRIVCKAAGRITARMRLKLPHKVTSVTAADENGNELAATCVWDENTHTALIAFPSTNAMTTLHLHA